MSGLFSARDTVMGDTPARSATCFSVTAPGTSRRVEIRGVLFIRGAKHGTARGSNLGARAMIARSWLRNQIA